MQYELNEHPPLSVTFDDDENEFGKAWEQDHNTWMCCHRPHFCHDGREVSSHGWLCPRCKRVNAPYVDSCECRP